jgi:hypothetical protein
MHSRIVDTLATAAARLEESAYPQAVILPNFPRSIQLDYHSSGVLQTVVLKSGELYEFTMEVLKQLQSDHLIAVNLGRRIEIKRT